MQWNNIRVLPGTATLQLSMQLWIAAWFHPNWHPKNHWRDVSLSSTIIYCDCKNWNGSSLKYDDYKNKKKLDDVCFSVNDDSSMDDPPLLELGNTHLCKSWFTCAVFYCTAGSIVRLYLHVNILSLDFLIQFIWNWLVLCTQTSLLRITYKSGGEKDASEEHENSVVHQSPSDWLHCEKCGWVQDGQKATMVLDMDMHYALQAKVFNPTY